MGCGLVGILLEHAAIYRSKRTVFNHFCFRLKPVLQVLTFSLATGLVDLLGSGSNLPLDRPTHQGPLFFPSSFDIHCCPLTAGRVLSIHFYDNRTLLTEDYTRLTFGVTKVIRLPEPERPDQSVCYQLFNFTVRGMFNTASAVPVVLLKVSALIVIVWFPGGVPLSVLPPPPADGVGESIIRWVCEALEIIARRLPTG